MATITDINSRRNEAASSRRPIPTGARFVTCQQCGERHPIVRLATGGERCFTAFADADRWFCQNRGCRAAWLART